MSSNTPPTQPAQVNNQARRAFVFGVLSVVVIALVIIVSKTFGTFNLATGTLDSSCTIGIVGWPSSITLQGSSSNQDCNMFVQQYPQQYYHMSDPPSGNTMCEGDLPNKYYQFSPSSYYKFYIPNGLNEVHYIVRSAPDYNAIGNSICSALIGPQSQ